MPTKNDPQPIVDNPTGDAFRTLPDDGRRYEVINTAVGNYRQAAVVSAQQLGPGAQIPRLLALGAIRELTPTEIEAANTDPNDPVNAPLNPLAANVPENATGNPHPADQPPGKPSAPAVVNPPDGFATSPKNGK